tara:strand:- start:17533 stop:18144 length:612 start_codon:yes stop_codon:yes gene_type:complete
MRLLPDSLAKTIQEKLFLIKRAGNIKNNRGRGTMNPQHYAEREQTWITAHEDKLSAIGFDLVTPDRNAGLLKQLEQELSPGHLIYGINASVLGAFSGTDDIILKLESEVEGAQYALVHLTWGGPQSPPCPSTQLIADLDEWLESVIPSPEKIAEINKFNEVRRRREKRRNQLSQLGYYLFILLVIVTLFFAFMTQIKPEWFGL